MQNQPLCACRLEDLAAYMSMSEHVAYAAGQDFLGMAYLGLRGPSLPNKIDFLALQAAATFVSSFEGTSLPSRFWVSC